MTSTADHLATIDLLRARDFPDRPGVAGSVASGPGFHVADLLVSEDFWDADLERLMEVEEEFEAELEALVQVLSLRWGEPEVLDLTGHLERQAMGEPVPEPLASLCGYVGRVYGWRTGGRWIGLGIGQGDRELPLQLVAAIGEDSVC